MKPKQIVKLVPSILLFFCLLLAIFLFFGPALSFSSFENRTLKTKPQLSFQSLWNGAYWRQLEQYYRDHFPKRSNILKMGTKLEKKLGKKSEKDVSYGKDHYLLQKPVKLDKKQEQVVALNEFYQQLNYINMTIMIVPNHITVNPQLRQSHVDPGEEQKELTAFYHNLKFNSIDLVQVLKGKNYPMYYKTDPHWTSYAAYYAYRAYCQSNNFNAYDLSDFDVENLPNQFYGTLYSKALEDSKEMDYLTVFHPKWIPQFEQQLIVLDSSSKQLPLYDTRYLSKQDKYHYFLGKNRDIITIQNQAAKNKQELLVLKDDSANALLPFLSYHYQKITVIDPQLYQGDLVTYLKEHEEIKDILFVFAIDTFA